MDQFYDEHHESRIQNMSSDNEDAGLLTSWSYIMLHGVDDDSRPLCASGCVQHIMSQLQVCFFPSSLSCVW